MGSNASCHWHFHMPQRFRVEARFNHISILVGHNQVRHGAMLSNDVYCRNQHSLCPSDRPKDPLFEVKYHDMAAVHTSPIVPPGAQLLSVVENKRRLA